MTLSDLWRILRQKKQIQTTKPLKIGKSEEEKQLELEERRNEIELNRLKISEAKRARFRKELDDLHSEIIEDSSDDYEEEAEEDDIPDYLKPFMPLIVSKLGGMANSQNSTSFTPQVNQEATQQHVYAAPQISDEELRGFLNTLPKSQLKLAKTMPKTALYNIVNQKMPLSQQDFERGYQILITEY